GPALDDRGAVRRGGGLPAHGHAGLALPHRPAPRARPAGPHRHRPGRGRHRPGGARGAGRAAADRRGGRHQRGAPRRGAAVPAGAGEGRRGGPLAGQLPCARLGARRGPGARRDRAPCRGRRRQRDLGTRRGRRGDDLAGPSAPAAADGHLRRPRPPRPSRRGAAAMTTPHPDDPPIRVVVAEDHPAVRSGLVALVAADGQAALAAAHEHRPDVVLTDVRMPGATGIEITPQLRAAGASVLVISGFDLDDFVLGALSAGADGYLVKTEEPQRILAAVRDVHRGDAVLSAAATRAVVGALRDRPTQDAPDRPAAPPPSVPSPAFTRREEDVLALVAEGMTN